MRNEHLNYRRTMDNTLLIANLFRTHELNAQLTENALVLPETVGFKTEAVDEEGIWGPCTVEDVSNDPLSIVSFDGWNAEWNCRICDPREIRNRMESCCKSRETV